MYRKLFFVLTFSFLFSRNTFISITLILLLCFIFNSCSTTKEVAASEKEYPINIIIDNSSSGKNPVHIVTKLDNGDRSRKDSSIIITDSDFYNFMNHPVKEYNFTLKEGSYWIRAKGGKENAVLDVLFIVDRPLWLLIRYVDEKHFQLLILQHQPVFG